MAASASNKSRKSRAVTAGNPSRTNTSSTGKNAAYRTTVSGHDPIHSKERLNWFILGSWSVILIMCMAFWAGVIALALVVWK